MSSRELVALEDVLGAVERQIKESPHWSAEVADFTRNLLADLRALPRAGELEALREAVDEAYEAIDAALALIPANRPPKSDSERFCNLLRGMLTIENRATLRKEQQ